MKAPTYPDAVQSADAMPTISRIPAEPFELVRSWIGSLNVSAADAGPTDVTTSVSESVTVFGSPTSPTIETSAIRAGKIDNTA